MGLLGPASQRITMKTFMAVYIGTKASVERSGWDKLDDAARQARIQAGMRAWQEWTKANLKNIVLPGAPLGKATRISPHGVTPAMNPLSGFVVVRAESQEDAARMFANHPHFTIFPGESVEIMECLPVQGPQ
jgi:hypothetical protein